MVMRDISPGQHAARDTSTVLVGTGDPGLRLDRVKSGRIVVCMEKFAALLRGKGLRNTPYRRAVLLALEERPHATVVEVVATLERIASDAAASAGGAKAAGIDGLSRQGLYNVLEDLRRAGLVRSIEPAGSPVRFELQTHDNHHHLVCRRCGRVQVVACAVGATPCLDPIADENFVIDEAEVTWWGTCQDCLSLKSEKKP
jgi:Fe2+ or Zn2+ uptake regulation protein